MKTWPIILLAIICLVSCSEDQDSTCKVIQAIESQDYQNGGEKLQYDFIYTDEVMSQMKKSVFIDGTPQYFYSMNYFYNDKNQLVLAEKRNTSNLLTSFELEYENDRLTRHIVKSGITLARAERIISYNADNEINRVDYESYKDGEADPFEVFYITIQPTSGDFQYLVSYYDTQDQFTGSIEIKTKSISTTVDLKFLFLERYYNTPQYLFGNENVTTELIYKDKDGAIGTTLSYDYLVGNGIMDQFTMDYGIRVDLFEFKYECK